MPGVRGGVTDMGGQEKVLLALAALWLGFAVIVAFAARSRGRNAVLYSILSIIASPILALIALALDRNDRSAKPDDRVPCPFCAEDIKPEAIVCPHCRTNLSRSSLADRLRPRLMAFGGPLPDARGVRCPRRVLPRAPPLRGARRGR